MSGLATEVVRETDRFEALAPEWWELWRRVPNATPFGSPAWLVPWWRAFAPGRLLTLAVRDSRRLVALAPLYLEEGAAGRRVLPVGISLSDYGDVLVDPVLVEKAGAELMGSLARLADHWDCLNLEELPPHAAALRLPAPAGWTAERGRQSACPVISLPASPDGLVGLIPARRLRKLRMARHRLMRRGGAVRRIEAGEIVAVIQRLFALHGARWQGRGEEGVLADGAVQAFHLAAAPLLAEAGLLRLYVVTIEGETVGIYHGLHHGEHAYAYLGGFDPAFSFESPGAVLLGHALEEAVREGAREFHLLRGQEPYKYEWGAVDRWNERLIFSRPA